LILHGVIVLVTQCEQEDVNLDYAQEYIIPTANASMQSFFEYDDSFFVKRANKMSSKFKGSKGHPVNFKKL